MVLFILFLLFLLFAAMVGYAWYRLRKDIHGKVTRSDQTPSTYSLPFNAVSFTTHDGIELAGWHIPVPKPKAVVILVHGRILKNGGKASMLEHALYLYENGYSTFLFDMRGYEKQYEKGTGFGEKEWQDVVSAHEYMSTLAENRGVKIGFFGISLGGVAALIAAGKEGIGDFIIACVPFATHGSLFAYQVQKEKLFPRFLFQWAVQCAALITLGLGYQQYNALSYVHRIKSPVFLIAAVKDALVNPKDAWNLFEKAQKPKEYWEAPTGHDVFGEKKEEFITKVLRFLQLYIA